MKRQPNQKYLQVVAELETFIYPNLTILEKSGFYYVFWKIGQWTRLLNEDGSRYFLKKNQYEKTVKILKELEDLKVEQLEKNCINDVCPICLEQIKEMKGINIMKCKHIFHKACVRNEYGKLLIQSCPICRGKELKMKKWQLDEEEKKRYLLLFVELEETLNSTEKVEMGKKYPMTKHIKIGPIGEWSLNKEKVKEINAYLMSKN